MNRFSVEIVGARPEIYSAAPLLTFLLRITDAEAREIDTIALRAQIMIDPKRRRYSEDEGRRLDDLFGSRDRWGETVRPLLWTHASIMVRSFTRSVDVELPVPLTYDFQIASSKYFHALDGGSIPVEMLFSGTVFTKADNGFSVAPVPWDLEARYELPSETWKSAIDVHFPNQAWIAMRRDLFDELYRFKQSHGLATWDDVITSLTDLAKEAR